MFSSLTLSWSVTVLFAVIGLISLNRLYRIVRGDAVVCGDAETNGGGAILGELSQLFMSVAMIAMTWGWGARLSSESGTLQVVVFSALAAVFSVRVIFRGGQRASNACHLVMALSMVWMIAAMPTLMHPATPTGAAEAAASAGVHGAHVMADMPGTTDIAGMEGHGMSLSRLAGTTADSGLVVLVTVVLAVALIAFAVWWVLRTVDRGAKLALDHGTNHGTTTQMKSATRLAGRSAVAGSSALMSLAMGGALLAML